VKPYTGSFRLDEGFDVAIARRGAESIDRAIDEGDPRPWSHVGLKDNVVTTMGDRFGPVFHFFTSEPKLYTQVEFYDLVEGDAERSGPDRKLVQKVRGIALRQANPFEIARIWQLNKAKNPEIVQNARPGTWWEIAVD